MEVAAGSSVTLSLSPTDVYVVRIPADGEAYVDLLSGATGSPYASPRLKAPTTELRFGPYGANSMIRIRSITGTADCSTAAGSNSQAPVGQSVGQPDTGWKRAAIIMRLLISGTGSVTVRARNRNLVETVVDVFDVASAYSLPCFTYLGDDATEFRISCTGTTSVEIF